MNLSSSIMSGALDATGTKAPEKEPLGAISNKNGDSGFSRLISSPVIDGSGDKTRPTSKDKATPVSGTTEFPANKAVTDTISKSTDEVEQNAASRQDLVVSLLIQESASQKRSRLSTEPSKGNPAQVNLETNSSNKTALTPKKHSPEGNSPKPIPPIDARVDHNQTTPVSPEAQLDKATDTAISNTDNPPKDTEGKTIPENSVFIKNQAREATSHSGAKTKNPVENRSGQTSSNNAIGTPQNSGPSGGILNALSQNISDVAVISNTDELSKDTNGKTTPVNPGIIKNQASEAASRSGAKTKNPVENRPGQTSSNTMTGASRNSGATRGIINTFAQNISDAAVISNTGNLSKNTGAKDTLTAVGTSGAQAGGVTSLTGSKIQIPSENGSKQTSPHVVTVSFQDSGSPQGGLTTLTPGTSIDPLISNTDNQTKDTGLKNTQTVPASPERPAREAASRSGILAKTHSNNIITNQMEAATGNSLSKPETLHMLMRGDAKQPASIMEKATKSLDGLSKVNPASENTGAQLNAPATAAAFSKLTTAFANRSTQNFTSAAEVAKLRNSASSTVSFENTLNIAPEKTLPVQNVIQTNLADAKSGSIPLNAVAFEMARQFKGGTNRFQIRLDPPELGRIDVRMNVTRDGKVSAHLVVEKPETLAVLNRDAPALERALNTSGLETDKNALSFSLSGGDHGSSNGEDSRKSASKENAEFISADNPEPIDTNLKTHGYISPSGVDIHA